LNLFFWKQQNEEDKNKIPLNLFVSKQQNEEDKK